MATANVKLYYGTSNKPWLLTANKFFVIDDIASYLSTFTPLDLSNFQYIKCGLEVSIVCDLSQVYSEPLYTNGIKYVSIKNSDSTKTYYYYVKNAEWRAKQSVKLWLVMDVANTYKFGTDFGFNDKTKIIREQKDRFQVSRSKHEYHAFEEIPVNSGSNIVDGQLEVSINNYEDTQGDRYTSEDEEYYDEYGLTRVPVVSIYDDTLRRYLIPFTEFNPMAIVNNFEVIADEWPSITCKFYMPECYKNHDLLVSVYPYYQIGSNTYRRIIDLQSEGLSPILYKKQETILNRSGILNCDWFLLYRNQNDPTEALVNPVECYLIPSNNIATNIGSIGSGGRINPANLMVNFYYYIPLRVHQSETLMLSNGVVIQSPNNDTNPVVIVRKIDEENIMIYETEVISSGGTSYIEITQTHVCTYFNISYLPCFYKTRTTIDTRYTFTAFSYDSFPNSWTTSGVAAITLDKIDMLDRTDAKNIKLIKLPYVPYNFSIDNNKLVVSNTDWEVIQLTQSGGGIINILKLKNLNIKLNYEYRLGDAPYSVLRINTNQFNTFYNRGRSTYYESKLYHSDYYQMKYVYDSFSYVFQLERMNLNYFKTLPQDRQLNLQTKFVVSTTINSRFMFQFVDYQSVVGKEDYNNVMPVSRNNEIVLYNVPYINYIRTGFNYDVKNKQTQAISTWTSVGLGAASTLMALAFPSVPLKVAGVVASLVSTANSVKSAVVSQVQAERNIDEKMLTTKNQSTSVSGSDDVDLMSVYTENRAKLCKYECSDIMKELFYNLFFYTGYVSNRMGVPDINSRLYFNYVEADVILEDYANMSDEIRTELVNLFKNGLTYIHKVSEGTEQWDLEQKYENFEKSIIYL